MENLQSTSSDNVPTGGDLDSLLDALRAFDEASGLEPLADFGNINQADLLAINPRMPTSPLWATPRDDAFDDIDDDEDDTASDHWSDAL